MLKYLVDTKYLPTSSLNSTLELINIVLLTNTVLIYILIVAPVRWKCMHSYQCYAEYRQPLSDLNWEVLYGTLHGTYKIVHSLILIEKVCTVLCMVHIRLYTLWLGLYGTLHGTYKIVHSLTRSIRNFTWYI